MKRRTIFFVTQTHWNRIAASGLWTRHADKRTQSSRRTVHVLRKTITVTRHSKLILPHFSAGQNGRFYGGICNRILVGTSEGRGWRECENEYVLQLSKCELIGTAERTSANSQFVRRRLFHMTGQWIVETNNATDDQFTGDTRHHPNDRATQKWWLCRLGARTICCSRVKLKTETKTFAALCGKKFFIWHKPVQRISINQSIIKKF